MEAIDNSYEGPVLSVEEVVEIEREVAKSGTPMIALMKRAGSAVSDVAQNMLACQEKPIVILAGSGNNGGDGWVAAGNLADAGYTVTLVTKQPATELTAEPAHTAAIEVSANGKFPVLVNPSQQKLGSLLQEAGLIIDAILGTGFAYDEVRAPYDEWIAIANEAHDRGAKTIDVDCPSGLNSQTGTLAHTTICADTTVTMIAVKSGLIQESAKTHVGKLMLAKLGLD